MKELDSELMAALKSLYYAPDRILFLVKEKELFFIREALRILEAYGMPVKESYIPKMHAEKLNMILKECEMNILLFASKNKTGTHQTAEANIKFLKEDLLGNTEITDNTVNIAIHRSKNKEAV